jgi:hypothetical protein
MPTPIEIQQDESRSELPPPPRSLLPKAVMVGAVVGGIYGATLGSVLATTSYAIAPIEIAAAVLAILGALWASKIGSLLGILSRVRFTRPFLILFSTVIASLVGVFPVLMAVALPWSLGGAVVGWFAGRRNAYSWRWIAAEILGAVLGGCVGTVIFSMQQNPTAGRLGMVWGGGIGIVVGFVLPWLFLKSLTVVLDSAANHLMRMRSRAAERNWQGDGDRGPL